MSAYDPKRTCGSALRMSAFGGKRRCERPASLRLLSASWWRLGGGPKTVFAGKKHTSFEKFLYYPRGVLSKN
jgi:hypothetical protein